MDEEHITQGSTSVDGEDPVTASGDDVTMFVTEDEAEHEDPVTSVTGNEAEHEDPVTSVTGNEAEHENPVTSVTEDEAEHENPVTSVTNEKPDTKPIRLNVTDIDRITEMGYEGEKPALIVNRLLNEIEELRSGAGTAGTAVVPGQQSFSLKDAMNSLKDVCDDDSVRLKFASKMLETQAAAANSHLAREHDAEQKRLDRAEKDKDRALKKELAESREVHDKDMTMIKKGMVKEKDLEDIVFLGQKNTSPADRIRNKQELAARQAAHEEDETGNLDPPGEDPAHD